VDTTPPPVPTITSGPTGPTNDATPAFTFSSSGATAFKCSIDVATPVGACSSPFTPATLSEGNHTFHVSASDALGNTSAANNRSFSVDTTPPPVPTITSGPTGPTNDATPAFTFSSSGATAFKCSIDLATPVGACSSPFTPATPLAQGLHTFYVSASDGVGNASGTANNVFSVDTTPPVLTGPGNRTVEADGPGRTRVNFFVSASDEGLALLPSAVSCNPSSGAGFPFGESTVDCSANDAAGNTGTLKFNVTVVDTTPPRINAPNASFTATDASGVARTNNDVAAYLAGITATDLVSSVTLTTTTPDKLPIGTTTIIVKDNGTGEQANANGTATVR